MLLSTAGEGDDDQRAKLAAARKLQRNGEQVGHSPFLAAVVPIFLLEKFPCRGAFAHFWTIFYKFSEEPPVDKLDLKQRM